MSLANSDDFVSVEDIKDLLRFILQNEKRVYRENPLPTTKEINLKEKEYYNKVEEVTRKIAIREGIDYEN